MNYLLLFISLFAFTFGQNKVVYLFSLARSLSTVTFRMFENRDDFVGFHEPCLLLSEADYLNKYLEDKKAPHHFNSFDVVKEAVFEKLETSHVVMKDVAFLAIPSLKKDDEFMKNKDVHFIFIVRNPYQNYLSIAKGQGFQNDWHTYLANIKELYHLYERAKAMSPNKVQILFIDELSQAPEKTLRKTFDTLDIPFSEKSLSWKALGDSFTGETWHEQKVPEICQAWHHAAINSTHLRYAQPEPLPTENLFHTVIDQETRKLMIDYYKEQLPFYYKFLKEASS